jgi:membrane protease YdiL (CAAX protease family)
MRAIAAAGLSHILVAYMILVWPALVRRRYQMLQRGLQEHDPNARMRAYRRMLLHQGGMVLVVIAILVLGAIPASRVGFLRPVGEPSHTRLLLSVLGGVIASGLVFRWKGDHMVRRLFQMAGAILPVTPPERWTFAAISVGAGFSEELLFRGFLMDYLGQNFASLDTWALVLISSVIFGFAHLYQGWRGTVLTGVLGGAFGMLYTFTGSLLAPAAIHAAVDLRLLIIVTPERMRAFGLAQDTPHSVE